MTAIIRRNALNTLRLVTDAVVAELLLGLQAGDFDVPIGFHPSPQRIYDTELQLEDASTGSIDAVMGDVDVEMLDRRVRQYDCRVDVVVRQKIDLEDQDQIDALIDFAGSVLDYITPSDSHPDAAFGHPLSTMPEATWIKTEVTAPYIPEHIRSLNQVTCILGITYRVFG